MDPNSQIGELFEKGQNATQSTVSDVANALKGQVLGDKKPTPSSQNSTSQSQQPVSSESVQNSTDHTKEVVGDFYAPSENTLRQAQNSQSLQNDQANLVKIRQELQSLHNEVYYKPLFAYENKKQQEEERPADKAEKQKMEDLKEEQEKRAKGDQDIAVQRAQKGVETRASAG